MYEPASFLVGKRDSHYDSSTNFSKNVVVAETSHKVLEALSFAAGGWLNLLQ